MDGLYDEVRAALHMVWQRRWLALAIAWVLCLAGWLVVSQIPNQYVSTARIDVQLRSILPTQDGTISRAEQEKDIDRVRQTLTSGVNLAQIVRDTDLARTVANDRDMGERVAMLQRAIKVTPQQDNLFEISATIADASASDAANAKRARDVVKQLIDIFVQGNIQTNRAQTGESLRFLDTQLAQRQAALQEAEGKKAAFQTQFMGSLPGTGTIADRVGQARTQLSQVSADLAAAQSSLSAVNGQMAGTPASMPGAAGVSGPARARLAAIQGQLAEARGRGWTDSHPDIIALTNQLNLAQAAARSEPLAGGDAGATNPLYFSLRSMQADRAAQVAALSQRKAQLESDLSAMSRTLADEPGVAGELAAIDRDYLVLKDQYDKLLASREQVRLRSQVQSQTEAVRFSVIDPPSSPRSPAAPNRPLLLTAVLLAGLGGGVAAAFALGKLRTTYPTPQRLQQASGLPVIGAIGEVVTSMQAAHRARQLKVLAGGTGALVAAFLVLMGTEFLQRGLVA